MTTITADIAALDRLTHKVVEADKESLIENKKLGMNSSDENNSAIESRGKRGISVKIEAIFLSLVQTRRRVRPGARGHDCKHCKTTICIPYSRVLYKHLSNQ